MANRRFFIKGSMAGLALTAHSPITNTIASSAPELKHSLNKRKYKLRFAIASDGHYGQPSTDYVKYHTEMVQWLNDEHEKNPLNFLIINGDLVHDKPALLSEVKKNHYDHLKMPFYALPGNHDHADTALWKSVFGYEDNYAFEKNGVGFILANTSDISGKYLCPDNVFLKRKLEAQKNLKTVFVILHIPPHFWVPESPFVECADTIKLLHSYENVKAVFHGHDHSLDSVFYTDKLPHFFDAHIGGNWGTSYRGYRIVEVNEDNTLHTYQVNASKAPVLNETKF